MEVYKDKARGEGDESAGGSKIRLNLYRCYLFYILKYFIYTFNFLPV